LGANGEPLLRLVQMAMQPLSKSGKSTPGSGESTTCLPLTPTLSPLPRGEGVFLRSFLVIEERQVERAVEVL